MPIYTIEQLNILKTSDLVTCPEFLWNEIETVPAGTHFQENQSNWRRGSHNSKRPVVVPKAAIPFSQRALFDTGKSADPTADTNDNDDDKVDDDEYAARILLKSKKKTGKQTTDPENEDGAPVVNLSYAAALAATMKMSESANADAVAEVAAGDDEGWVSVTQSKPRRNRHKQGSFSKWKSS